MDSSDSVMCVLCQRSDENKFTGALASKGEVTAHQNCLLYSSGLYCRDSPDFDDLFGFAVEDVLSEKQRGLKLNCSKCKKKGATAGCENKNCKKSYHYPCAIKAKARTFDDKRNGRFGLYCFLCHEKNCHLSSEGEFDDDFPSTSTHNPKRKLDFSDRALKRSRRVISNDSSDSDVTDASETMFAPLESDLEMNNSAPGELLNGNLPVIATVIDHPQEIQDTTENAVTSLQHSAASAEQSYLQGETSDISIDSSQFWSECTAAGCAQAIFKDFTEEITDIFNRIVSGQASKQDCDVAFNTVMASGKLGKLVAKQQKDLQKKLAELQQATTTLNKVALSLPKCT